MIPRLLRMLQLLRLFQSYRAGDPHGGGNIPGISREYYREYPGAPIPRC
jgi:hypothetical protein